MGSIGGSSCKTTPGKFPWHKYQWRLCVSYQKLNQVNSPFDLPVTRCNDSVQDINTEANYFIAVEMDSGYWQVVAEEDAR